MKKLLLALIFAIGIISLNAQFYGGIKTGVQKTNLKVSGTALDLDNILGEHTSFTAGLVFGYDLSPNFALQSEINYVRKGFSAEATKDVSILGAQLPFGLRADTRIDYIEVPVLVRGKVGNGPLKIFGEAGFFGGYAYNAEFDLKARFIADIVVLNDQIDLTSDSYNRLDLGAALGGGFEYDLERGRVMFGVRYQHSINDMLDDSLLGLELRNQSLSGQVSYVYKF